MENLMEKAHDLAVDIACEPPSCSGCCPVIIEGKLVHEPGCPWLNAPVGGGLGIIDASDSVNVALDVAVEKHEGESPLEEAFKKHMQEKEDAFVNWMAEHYDGFSKNMHEYRIGFYGGYDIGSIPFDPLEEEKQLNAQSEAVDEMIKNHQDIAREVPTGKEKEEPITPEGYGELKVGMEGKLNGVPVRVRKITKKDIIMRPLNRTIRDKDGMMVSFKEGKSG